ncbi:MAG: lipase family protein [Cypionkella sp.]
MATPTRKLDTFLNIPNFADLLPPPKVGHYRYFEGHQRFPFAYQTAQHSAINAWWLADYSLLVYENEQKIKTIFDDLWGKQTYRFAWLESHETSSQGFLVETADYAVMVFRGTEFPPPSVLLQFPLTLIDIIKDILTDIEDITPQTIATENLTFDVPVHTGFVEALQSLWQPIQAQLDVIGFKPLFLTGHSLGGAIATLLAFQLKAQQFRSLYTFGCPCVGDVQFAQAFHDKNLDEKTYRYWRGDDAVAKGFTLTGQDYQPVGQEFWFEGGLHSSKLEKGINTAINNTIGLNQLDHPPILYCYDCWNAIPD